MSAAANKIGALIATSEVELDALRLRRSELAFAAIEGDVQARAELASVSLQIAEIEDRLDLAGLAVTQEAKRERQAAQNAAEAEKRRLEAEADRLTGERDAAIKGVQRRALGTGRAVSEALRIESELAAVNDQLDRPTRGISSILGNLVFIHVRDESGVAVEKVMAGLRKILLDEYPPPSDEPELVEQGARCSICGHEQLEAIERALEAGESVRAVGERYGVGRMALTRHKAHGA